MKQILPIYSETDPAKDYVCDTSHGITLSYISGFSIVRDKDNKRDFYIEWKAVGGETEATAHQYGEPTAEVVNTAGVVPEQYMDDIAEAVERSDDWRKQVKYLISATVKAICVDKA